MPDGSSERDPWLRFALGFGALAILSELVYYGVALESELFQHYLRALARINGGILSWLTPDVQVTGKTISSPLFSVEIARGCDAYRLCALFAAAVIAFPSSLRLKLWGILLGLVWLNALNFVRIVGLFFVGGYWHAHFRTTHEVYFPAFLIAMTVAAWVVWVRWATDDPDAGSRTDEPAHA